MNNITYVPAIMAYGSLLYRFTRRGGGPGHRRVAGQHQLRRRERRRDHQRVGQQQLDEPADVGPAEARRDRHRPGEHRGRDQYRGRVQPEPVSPSVKISPAKLSTHRNRRISRGIRGERAMLRAITNRKKVQHRLDQPEHDHLYRCTADAERVEDQDGGGRKNQADGARITNGASGEG
jgi:hypothetical protein